MFEIKVYEMEIFSPSWCHSNIHDDWKTNFYQNLPDATKEKYKRQADDFNANRPKPSKPELEYSEHYNEIASPLLGPTGQPGKYTKAM